MDEVNLYVEVEIHPTETEEKVKAAVENIFGDIPLRVESLPNGSRISAKSTGLEALTKLHNLLRRERIRNAARAIFFEGLHGNTVTFFLNKQVAYSSHLSFSKETAESPLGPIKVRIQCADPRELIEWLAPRIV